MEDLKLIKLFHSTSTKLPRKNTYIVPCCIAQGSKCFNKKLQIDRFMELIRCCTKFSCRCGRKESGGSMAQKLNNLLSIQNPSLSLPEALIIICQEDQQVHTAGSWKGWCHAKDPTFIQAWHGGLSNNKCDMAFFYAELDAPMMGRQHFCMLGAVYKGSLNTSDER